METQGKTIEAWLRRAAAEGASDLHVVPNHPPTIRLHGELVAWKDEPSSAETRSAGLRAVCSVENLNKLDVEKNIDFALTLRIDSSEGSPFDQRFRANYFLTSDGLGACFRVIPSEIPSFAWADFPEELATKLAHFRNGLVLVTGVTGAGKTTTLAMIVDLLNQGGGHRIITAEDPIEYVFPRRQNSIVSQREVGQDIDSFSDGLKFGLRQDPDVILVGEIRDRETAQMALSAAETGHLVFSTMHTRDSKGAISRFTDLFDSPSQPEIRAQLAMSLRAVVSQHLLPSELPGKRQLALEVMINTNPIASAIRLGKLESIDTGITTGRSSGMVSLDESVRQLLKRGAISRDTAERFVTDATILSR